MLETLCGGVVVPYFTHATDWKWLCACVNVLFTWFILGHMVYPILTRKYKIPYGAYNMYGLFVLVGQAVVMTVFAFTPMWVYITAALATQTLNVLGVFYVQKRLRIVDDFSGTSRPPYVTVGTTVV